MDWKSIFSHNGETDPAKKCTGMGGETIRYLGNARVPFYHVDFGDDKQIE